MTAMSRRSLLGAACAAAASSLAAGFLTSRTGAALAAGSAPPRTTGAGTAPPTSAGESATIPDTAITAAAGDGSNWSGPSVNRQPADDEVAAHWQEVFETMMQQDPIGPGLWVTIADPDLGYWQAAIGNAVVDGAPATIEDHNRIGSITKTFAAVAVLQLVADDKLTLDATVESVIPETAATFRPTAQITVEQLLNMTSGLPDYADSVAAQVAQDPTKVWTPNDLIAVALDAAPVQPSGTPGYSTTNYTILGLIIEQITGQPVEDVISDVAQQAGLANTALLPGDQNNMPDPSSHGYLDEASLEDLTSIGAEELVGTDVTDWSASWGGAGGGIYSTLDDLFAWTATAMGTTLLPADLGEQRLMLNTDLDGMTTYGLGIARDPHFPRPGWIGHSGQIFGWTAIGLYNTDTGAVFVAMSNGTSGIDSAVQAWANEL
jgi:D-alanyl-D-alanine carboxypeptidase